MIAAEAVLLKAKRNRARLRDKMKGSLVDAAQESKNQVRVAELIQQYKLEEQKCIAKNLRNIYVYNIIAYVNQSKITNSTGLHLDPDESFMRLIESNGGIKNDQYLEGWRKTINGAWSKNKIYDDCISLLDNLGPTFLKLAEIYQSVNKALVKYPNDISLYVKPKIDPRWKTWITELLENKPCEITDHEAWIEMEEAGLVAGIDDTIVPTKLGIQYVQTIIALEELESKGIDLK